MDRHENLSRSKEVLAAYLRQGAHELGSALYPAGTAAQHPEYGMAWTRTPGEIADGLRGREAAGHEHAARVGPTALDSYIQAPEHAQSPTQPEHAMPAPAPAPEPPRPDQQRDTLEHELDRS